MTIAREAAKAVGRTRDECVENAKDAYTVGRVADLVFALNVQKLRDEFGLTQRQIAEEVGVSQPLVSYAKQALDNTVINDDLTEMAESYDQAMRDVRKPRAIESPVEASENLPPPESGFGDGWYTADGHTPTDQEREQHQARQDHAKGDKAHHRKMNAAIKAAGLDGGWSPGSGWYYIYVPLFATCSDSALDEFLADKDLQRILKLMKELHERYSPELACAL